MEAARGFGRRAARRPAIITVLALAIASLAPTSEGIAQDRLLVSKNGAYLQREGGAPFFYTGDTAWALFHRLTVEESDRYLQDRARKGFNVIQAVAISELDGLTEPNAQGDLPFADRDPTRPNEGYFAHVDAVVDRANELGLVIGMLPSWGRYWREGDARIFTPASAEAYGEYLGRRYRDRDVIWILGGDSNIRSTADRAVIDAMAKGLRRGDGGRHLITFHPRGPGLSAAQLADAPWLDFNMNQSSHAGAALDTGLYVERSRQIAPNKPVVDGEPRYEGIPVGFYNQGHDPRVRFDDDDTRRAAWWAALAGAAGQTYGNNNIWQMWAPGRKPAIGANIPWWDALDHPGASQIGYLHWFMDEHHFETLVPAQSLLLDGPTTGMSKIRAARSRDGKTIIVYTPRGEPFTIDLGELKSPMHSQAWFDPRYGVSYPFRNEQSMGIQTFAPPTSGDGKDWVLVLQANEG